MAATSLDVTVNKRGRYELIDAELGPVTDLRFKYLCDEIRINRRRLDYMLEHLCDWSEADSMEARASVSQGELLELPEDDDVPKELVLDLSSFIHNALILFVPHFHS